MHVITVSYLELYWSVKCSLLVRNFDNMVKELARLFVAFRVGGLLLYYVCGSGLTNASIIGWAQLSRAITHICMTTVL